MTSFASRLARNLRTNLLAGLLVMVPVGVTILIFRLLFRKVDAILGPLMYNFLAKWRPELFDVERRIPGLGIFATLILLYVAGALTRVYLGRQIFGLWEWFIARVPLFGSINKAAKQIMSTIATPHAQAFRRVVFVRFPRDGMYLIGFVTGETRVNEGEVRTIIFTPTVPNPTTGYLFLAQKQEIIECDISVEEGIRMVVSAGISHRPAGEGAAGAVGADSGRTGPSASVDPA